MTEAAIAADVHEALDAHGDLTAKIAFDLVFLVDDLADFLDIRLGELVGAEVGADVCFLKDGARRSRTDTEDVSKSNFDPFISWQVNPSDTSHGILP